MKTKVETAIFVNDYSRTESRWYIDPLATMKIKGADKPSFWKHLAQPDVKE